MIDIDERQVQERVAQSGGEQQGDEDIDSSATWSGRGHGCSAGAGAL